MSRSFKHTPVFSYSGHGKTAYKRHLNRRLRHMSDVPSGGSYKRFPYNWEMLHGWYSTTVYHTKQGWEKHVQDCWDHLGTRFRPTAVDVLRSIRQPLVK